jgi:hypothetical protein
LNCHGVTVLVGGVGSASAELFQSRLVMILASGIGGGDAEVESEPASWLTVKDAIAWCGETLYVLASNGIG